MDGMSVNISRAERLMGTAGGVKRLADRFDGTFVIIMGDALTDIDVREVVAFHKEREALATLTLIPSRIRSGTGWCGWTGKVISWPFRRDPSQGH